MNYNEIIGIMAGVFTAASLLPQLIKTIKEKDASSISTVMLLVLITGISLWVYYGFLKNDIPIIATNIFSDLVNLTLLFFSIKYKKAKGDM
jgi:MtN3 and saliva related transmembrane protein